MSAPSRRSRSRSPTPLAQGARCLTGGKRHPAGPLFYQPTLLADVPDEALIMREETFGPVAAVTPFDSEDEVVARANATEYGLVAYVVTENGARQRAWAARSTTAWSPSTASRSPARRSPSAASSSPASAAKARATASEAFTDLKYLCLDVA